MTARLTEAELAELRRLYDAVPERLDPASLIVCRLDPTQALAAQAFAAAMPRLIAAARQANEQAERIARVADWTHQYGEDLVPRGADTYGEGKRDAKTTVAAILSKGGDANVAAVSLSDLLVERDARLNGITRQLAEVTQQLAERDATIERLTKERDEARVALEAAQK